MYDDQGQLPSSSETYFLITGRNPLSASRRHRNSEEGAQGHEIFMHCVNPIAHKNGDTHPSLRINPAKDTWTCDPEGVGGKSLRLIIHAGLARDNASAFAWLRDRGWISPNGRPSREVRELSGQQNVVESYIYDDGKGGIAGRIDRIQPGNGETKTFLQYRALPDGSFASGLAGGKLPLYRRGELLAACAAHEAVFLVEGERKCDRLRESLRDAGSHATVTTIGGGAKASLSPLLAKDFEGAKCVYALSDCDTPGRRAVTQRAAAIVDANKELPVYVVDLDPARGDGYDIGNWLEDGHSLAELRRLTDAISPFTPAEATSCHKIGLSLVVASSVEIKPIHWLMPHRMPANEFTLFEGDGDLGKSTVALNLVARKSVGSEMPDGTPCGPAANVLVIAEEDNLSVIAARLKAAGADLTRVHFVTGFHDAEGELLPFELPTHAGHLESEILTLKAELVYIDALFNHFEPDLSPDKAHDVRKVLRPLGDIAHRTGATIVGTRHFRKAAGSAAHRGSGNIDLRNVSRSVVAFAKDKEDDTLRIFVNSKHNLGRDTEALTYRLESATVEGVNGEPVEVAKVQWVGKQAISADEAVALDQPGDETSPIGEAVAFLQQTLADGPVAAVTVVSQARTLGIAEKTLRRAKSRLGVVSEKGNFKGDWAWVLPKMANYPQDGHDIERKNETIFGESDHLRDGTVPTTEPEIEFEVEDDEP